MIFSIEIRMSSIIGNAELISAPETFPADEQVKSEMLKKEFNFEALHILILPLPQNVHFRFSIIFHPCHNSRSYLSNS